MIERSTFALNMRKFVATSLTLLIALTALLAWPAAHAENDGHHLFNWLGSELTNRAHLIHPTRMQASLLPNSPMRC
jgi:hypothetical protein